MIAKSKDGTSIYYETVGNGQTILLLHGLGADHSIWEKAG